MKKMSTAADGDVAHDEFRELLDLARDYAGQYVAGVPTQRLNPDAATIARLDEFDEALPAEGSDAAAMLAMLHELGSPATLPTTGGRYFGFVNGGAWPPALAAKWLADVWDQNSALYVMSPIASRLEALVERWLVDLLGLPAGTAAGFVSGTSTALAAGFATARNELLARRGWDATSQGLFGAPPIRVVIGEQAHSTVHKALAFVGLGRDRVEIAPADDQGRILPGKMPKLDATTLLVVQAGNVNSGAFDPLDEICGIAGYAGAWVHVDGAFGLWAAASPRHKALVRGMQRADSFAADAHKTLNAPYDCGIVFCRDRAALARTMQATGSYLQTTESERDGSHFAPELSRRARAIELWAILKTLGRHGIAERIDRLCRHATVLADGMRANGFRVLNDVVFNQVLVACESPGQTTATLRNIQHDGIVWCGGAEWRGEPVIRVSVCSWQTSDTDIEAALGAFRAARARAI